MESATPFQITLIDKELSLNTGSVAPQQALISPERRALAVGSQNTPYRPAPSLLAPNMSVVETVAAPPSIKKRQMRRLRNVERVIWLLDSEINKEKQSLSIKLASSTLTPSSRTARGKLKHPALILHLGGTTGRGCSSVCERAIHAHSVVHSDLKPANFVLVKGRLKLIDFGIANAIQTDTTINVHRETIAGTVNDTPRVVKVGKPSDVWSLGCILCQMAYGMPPFGMIAEATVTHPCHCRLSYRIEFPVITEDGSRVPAALIQTMRRCLSHDQRNRPTCEILLSEDDDFLCPKEYNPVLSAAGDGRVLPMTEELLGLII
ncbi:kinase-like domain-containing protein [Xylaria curta]|nr:kinase-like domain-containing protein [Xylaria curta]